MQKVKILYNMISYLIKKGQLVTSIASVQPHSTIYYFDCGCMVNAEMNLHPRPNEALFRNWIVPCRKHNFLSQNNLSFRQLGEDQERLAIPGKKPPVQ